MQNSSANGDGGSIKVYARVRPHARNDFDLPPINPEDEVLLVDEENKAIVLNTKVPRTFAYDGVFGPTCSQETVFEQIGRSLVAQVLQGYNGSVYCYGQTGAGKTYTMQGPDAPQRRNRENWGLMPRMIDNIFLCAPKTEKCLFRISYLEIYKEAITDLLDPENTMLQIREDFKRGVFVERLNECTVWSVQEAMAVVWKGIHNRHVAATQMNERSSRSHAVFTFSVETRTTDDRGVTAIKVGKLNLIDLAGSERCSEDCYRVREAGAINRSLSVLTSVIFQLSQKDKGRHIHYRDSKLTFLLRESLGGNSKTAICANISALPACFGETLSTLKFAQRAKNIRTNAVLNTVFSGTVESLTLEVKELRSQLHQLTRQPSGTLTDSTCKPTDILNEASAAHARKLESRVAQCMQAQRASDIKQQNLETYCKFLEESNSKKDDYIRCLQIHSTLLHAIGTCKQKQKKKEEEGVTSSENEPLDALSESLNVSELVEECPIALPELGSMPPEIRKVVEEIGPAFLDKMTLAKHGAPASEGLDLNDMIGFANGSNEQINALYDENRVLRVTADAHPEDLRNNQIYRYILAENQVLRDHVPALSEQPTSENVMAPDKALWMNEETTTAKVTGNLSGPALVLDGLPLSGSDDSTTAPDGDGGTADDLESCSKKDSPEFGSMQGPINKEATSVQSSSNAVREKAILGDLLRTIDAAMEHVERLAKRGNTRVLTSDFEEKSENVLVNSLLASLNSKKPKQKKNMVQSPSLGALTRNKSTMSLHSMETLHPTMADFDALRFRHGSASTLGDPTLNAKLEEIREAAIAEAVTTSVSATSAARGSAGTLMERQASANVESPLDSESSNLDLLNEASNRMRVLFDELVQATEASEYFTDEFEQLAERYDNRIEECRFWELQCHRLNLHCTQLEDFVRKSKGMISQSDNRSYSLSSLRSRAMWNERMKSFEELQIQETTYTSDVADSHTQESSSTIAQSSSKQRVESPNPISPGLPNPKNSHAAADTRNSCPQVLTLGEHTSSNKGERCMEAADNALVDAIEPLSSSCQSSVVDGNCLPCGPHFQLDSDNPSGNALNGDPNGHTSSASSREREFGAPTHRDGFTSATSPFLARLNLGMSCPSSLNQAPTTMSSSSPVDSGAGVYTALPGRSLSSKRATSARLSLSEDVRRLEQDTAARKKDGMMTSRATPRSVVRPKSSSSIKSNNGTDAANVIPKTRKEKRKVFDREHFLALAADKDLGPNAAIAYLLGATGNLELGAETPKPLTTRKME